MLLSALSQKSKLVLVGGGHSHCVALANWRHSYPKSLPSENITLITTHEKTVYSGAVPGYLAGLFDRRACELAVGQLAQLLGMNVIIDEVLGLNLSKQQVICRNHDPIDFDIASLNIGSTPKLPAGVVASDRVIPMKPMGQMLDRLEKHLTNQTTNPVSLAIVGGGLGGIEVALSLKAHWGAALDLNLICRGSIAAAQNPSLRGFLSAELERRSIKIHDYTAVEMVKETIGDVTLKLSSGKIKRRDLVCNVSLWATEATPPGWLLDSGLTTDDRGFVLIDSTLRSLSHEQIFASGDVATLKTSPLPKAGVFAVRQGQTLCQNLPRSFARQPLVRFEPRSDYLSLISLGNQRAVASYGRLSTCQTLVQPLLWRWKRSIDGAFVDRINSGTHSFV